MQLKFSAIIFLAVVATVELSGCGTMVPGQSMGIVEKDADTAARLVTERAQQRWNALVKRDMEMAYQFISPAGRSLMSLDDYRPRINAGYWRGAKVKEAVCAIETCEVTVLLDMVAEGVKFTNPIKETWILDAGKWWFVYLG